MPFTPKAAWGLLKSTFQEFNEDKAPRLGAALAYYTIFSLAPLLIIVIAIAGVAFGQQAAQGQIVGQIRGLVGDQGAQMIQTMIDASRKDNSGTIATVISVITLLLGALGLFGALQDALNTIWEVQPKPSAGILSMIKNRLLSLTMVLGTGFLLLVSLVISAALSGFSGLLDGLFPGASTILPIVNTVLSFVVITLLFAMIFKVLPDVVISWRDVWIGAILTTLLFLIGRFLISFYLGRSSFGSTYGAAGSLIVILVWIYYSAQILFLGAEFTQVYANRYGSHVKPAPNAMAVTEEMRAQQGIPHADKAKQKATGTQRTLAPTPVPIKANVLRQRVTVASTEAVSPMERGTQAANPAEPVSSRMSKLSAIFGVLVGIIAGMSLSHSATTQHPRKH